MVLTKKDGEVESSNFFSAPHRTTSIFRVEGVRQQERGFDHGLVRLGLESGGQAMDFQSLVFGVPFLPHFSEG